MTSLYLARARLRREAPVTALANLLVPSDTSDRANASHRLVWSLFADHGDRQRDFLWREERPGHFMTLSNRPPEDPHHLFDLDYKTFEPTLSTGDRLGFTLRANPVVARPSAKGERGQRHDVVMDALRSVPPGERALARPAAVLSAGRNWFTRQGEAHGFVPCGDIAVDGYDRLSLHREARPATRLAERQRRLKPIVFGILDLTGVLEVSDPDRFLSTLACGFGRARAFGCGLMLIRRVR